MSKVCLNDRWWLTCCESCDVRYESNRNPNWVGSFTLASTHLSLEHTRPNNCVDFRLVEKKYTGSCVIVESCSRRWNRSNARACKSLQFTIIYFHSCGLVIWLFAIMHVDYILGRYCYYKQHHESIDSPWVIIYPTLVCITIALDYFLYNQNVNKPNGLIKITCVEMIYFQIIPLSPCA